MVPEEEGRTTRAEEERSRGPRTPTAGLVDPARGRVVKVDGLDDATLALLEKDVSTLI